MQTDKSPSQYRGIAHALRTVLREEGPRALYKGWLPSVIGVVSYSHNQHVFQLNYTCRIQVSIYMSIYIERDEGLFEKKSQGEKVRRDLDS